MSHEWIKVKSDMERTAGEKAELEESLLLFRAVFCNIVVSLEVKLLYIVRHEPEYWKILRNFRLHTMTTYFRVTGHIFLHLSLSLSRV